MSGAPVADAVLAEVGEAVAKLGRGRQDRRARDDPRRRRPGERPLCRPQARDVRALRHRFGGPAYPRRCHASRICSTPSTSSTTTPLVDGFLVQNPVPAGFDYAEALARVSPAKDVDGLHPVNLGYLALGERGHPRPCTPLGILAMLEYYSVPVEGRSVVVVGRGPTLGRPLALLLSLKERGANAAVTVVHTGVKDWAEYTRRADIVVGAAGVPNMITPDVVAPGSCVIGGGMTWEGRKALSDVDERCGEVAGWVTPRLGGVGVTTVAMLLRNTVAAAEASIGLQG